VIEEQQRQTGCGMKPILSPDDYYWEDGLLQFGWIP
jgi:hypothetical protein